jgi:hypothetical protein
MSLNATYHGITVGFLRCVVFPPLGASRHARLELLYRRSVRVYLACSAIRVECILRLSANVFPAAYM